MTRREELSSLIVMKRIFPQEFNANHIKESVCSLRSSLSEVGFYSSVLFDTKKNALLHSVGLGIVVRTKSSDSFEGGVSAGFAVMNSPIITRN